MAVVLKCTAANDQPPHRFAFV